mmetsp:Transcript_25398/g.70700  ORF Transcript_25398/g.70700 Transcript_25398/m.70700 type:complete len:322 (-) Transcript_25398:100-1065(-)
MSGEATRRPWPPEVDPANDPFLTGQGRLQGKLRAGGRRVTGHKAAPPLPVSVLSLLCSAPLGLFVVTALTLAVFWQVPAVWAAQVAIGIGILSTGSSVAGRVVPRGSGLPAATGCIAVAAGGLTGLYAHEAYVGPFIASALGREYRNVLASSPAAAYADAGRVVFADTSKADTSRAVGYRNRQTFCAAPVIDSGVDQARTIGFWAVGVDCCYAARGDFECGDAGNSGSQGGIRISPGGILETSYAEFLKAIEQAAVVNDLVVEADPILVHWVKDPGAEQRTALLRAFGVLLLGIAFFVLLLLAVAAASALAGDSGAEDLPQ